MLLLFLSWCWYSSAKACGGLRNPDQPPAIGAMAAGLMLGLLVFGTWLPGAHAAVFPFASPLLSGLGALGATLFMFIVGVEPHQPEGSRRQLRAAVSVGGFGILVPPPFQGLRPRSPTIGAWMFPTCSMGSTRPSARPCPRRPAITWSWRAPAAARPAS